MTACAAARAGAAIMKFKNAPFGSIRLEFTGTGLAEVDQESFNLLSTEEGDDSELRMDWSRNTFAGEHWLLGKFKIELNPTQSSFGIIRRSPADPKTMENINYFNFIFSFERLGDRVIRTTSPIINSATISAIPPKGSTYRVEAPNRMVKFSTVKTSSLYNLEGAQAAFPPEFEAEIEFCEITLFDRENVAIELVGIEDLTDEKKKVAVKLLNLEDQACRAVYFNVLHDRKIATKNDFGFLDLGPGEGRNVEFTVESLERGHSSELSFFSGIYKPEALRGAGELKIPLQFNRA